MRAQIMMLEPLSAMLQLHGGEMSWMRLRGMAERFTSCPTFWVAKGTGITISPKQASWPRKMR